MKVLQINATFANGSTGTIVQDLQQCREENGIECHIAYASSRLPQKEIRHGYKIGNVISNKLHALLARINGKQAYFSYLPTLMLLRHIAKIQPDVIHLHNLHSNYINLNMLLRYIAKKNIATVVTLHDCWYFTGGCFHYTNAKCDRWKHECGNCPKKLQDTKAYFLDKSKSILTDRYKYFQSIKNLTVVGVSNWIREEGKKSVFKNSNCITIHNGIDTDIFKPTPSDFRKQYGIEDKFVILGPASKWLSNVNKQILQLVVDGLEQDMVLVLFGCKESHIELPKDVIQIGFTASKEELAKLYSMADVFVNCTREDSLPTINIEAQACGLPVISYSNTGATETINIEYGECIMTGDVDNFLKAIMDIRKSRRANCSSVLSEWVFSEYNKASNYKKYVDLFNKVVD